MSDESRVPEETPATTPPPEQTPETPVEPASGPAAAGALPPTGTGAGSPRPRQAWQQATSGAAAAPVDLEANDNDRLMAGLAYASQVILPLVIPIVMLLAEPNKSRPYQRYHAIQSLVLLGALFVFEIVYGVVYTVLTVITLGCLGLLLWVGFLLPIVPLLYYGYLAYQGRRFEVPFVTSFMHNQHWA